MGTQMGVRASRHPHRNRQSIRTLPPPLVDPLQTMTSPKTTTGRVQYSSVRPLSTRSEKETTPNPARGPSGVLCPNQADQRLQTATVTRMVVEMNRLRRELQNRSHSSSPQSIIHRQTPDFSSSKREISHHGSQRRNQLQAKQSWKYGTKTQ